MELIRPSLSGPPGSTKKHVVGVCESFKLTKIINYQGPTEAKNAVRGNDPKNNPASMVADSEVLGEF